MTMTNQPLPSTMASSSAQDKPPLSKRQRRAQGPNPSNTWQQQPRIKSAGARARAYIAYAGLADDDDDDARGSNNANGKKKKKKKEKQQSIDSLLDPQLDLHSPEVKFGRLLGGTDQRSRHNAVKMLREYLRARSDIATGAGLSELDLLKLWKGLWYTLYMADKVPVQDKLSKILAELMWCLAGTEEEDEYAGQMYTQIMEENEDALAGEDGDTLSVDEDGDTMEIIEMGEGDSSDDNEEGVNDNSSDDDDDDGDDQTEVRIKDMNEKHCRGAHLVSLYIATFLRTVRREWGNVDKHRVDKFYTAVRCMVSEAFKYMSKRHWNIGIVSLFTDVFYTEGLSADTPGLTNGLRYHLIDICVDELAKVNRDADLPLTEATFLDCLEPFFGLGQKADDKNVQKRVLDKVLTKFLEEYSFVSPIALMDEDDELGEEYQEAKALVFNQVHVGTVSKFVFEMASHSQCDERYRKSLYDMHKTYERQIRAAGRDVDLDGTGDNDDDDVELDEEGDMQDAEVEEVTEENEGEVSHQEKEVVDADDVTSHVERYEPTPDKKKKRKKKSKGGKEEERTKDYADILTPTQTKADNVTPKSKPSSKKKRKKQDSGPPNESGDAEDLITPKSNKRKKQKSPPSVDPRSMPSPDQVESPESADNEANFSMMSSSKSKRVSFGAMNSCKSHKASMKAVKQLDKERWDTKSRTPEKGILRPGGESSIKKKLPSSRRSASLSKKKGRKHK